MRPLFIIHFFIFVQLCFGEIPAKPNILFIFSDDQCFETLGKLGLTEANTPNLDRLSEQGARFDRAYNMGSEWGGLCGEPAHAKHRCLYLAGPQNI